MMALIIIFIGIVSALAGSMMLLRFLSDFSELLAKFNELYQGEIHSLNSELREELNELNYSYYDILEKQDERISKLEKLAASPVSSDAPPFCVTDEAEGEGAEEGGAGENFNADDGDSAVNDIKRLYNRGMSAEDIAGELGLGSGYVELILSLYVNKGEE